MPTNGQHERIQNQILTQSDADGETISKHVNFVLRINKSAAQKRDLIEDKGHSANVFTTSQH